MQATLSKALGKDPCIFMPEFRVLCKSKQWEEGELSCSALLCSSLTLAQPCSKERTSSFLTHLSNLLPMQGATPAQEQFLGCPVSCSVPPPHISMPQMFCQVPSNPRISQEPGALKSSEVGYTSPLGWEDNEKGSQGWEGGWRPSCTPPAPLALTRSALSGNCCVARC